MSAFRRSFILPAIVLLAGSPAVAQPTLPRTAPPAAVHRDLTLERAATARANALAAHMQPTARSKLDLAARAVLAQLAAGPENANPHALAEREVRRRFGRLSTQQSDLLSFYVLARAAELLPRPAGLRSAPVSSDTSEMSEMASLRLQAAMDRKSKFMSMLSNLMKKTSDVSATMIQNLK